MHPPPKRAASPKDPPLETSERSHEPVTSAPRVPITVPPDGVDQARVRAAVRELLLAIGENPDRDGLRDTPARVGRLFAEVFAGLLSEPRLLLRKTFEVDH